MNLLGKQIQCSYSWLHMLIFEKLNCLNFRLPKSEFYVKTSGHFYAITF
jgi:hypothetical protein